MTTTIRGKLVLGLFVGLCTWLIRDAKAHEVKVLLDRMNVQPGDEDIVYLAWGHRLPTDQPTRGSDIERYQLVTPSGSIRKLDVQEESEQRNKVRLDERGIYVAEAIRKPTILTIFRFEDRHVHFVGPKSKIRKGATVEDSFRSFQFAKAIAVAGEGNVSAKPLGHALEIVPLTSPSDWRSGRDISFQVLFEGKPLSGKLFQAKPILLKPDDVWTWTRPTDEDGKAILQPDRPGIWLIKATLERPADPRDRDQYDIDHWTATLVIEIQGDQSLGQAQSSHGKTER